jgi:hypothetical protein
VSFLNWLDTSPFAGATFFVLAVALLFVARRES